MVEDIRDKHLKSYSLEEARQLLLQEISREDGNVIARIVGEAFDRVEHREIERLTKPVPTNGE